MSCAKERKRGKLRRPVADVEAKTQGKPAKLREGIVGERDRESG